jgi:hypothetical protein
MPIRALMSKPITTVVLELMELSMESKEALNCSCFVSLQGKYAKMRAIVSDLPLILFPRLLKESNLTFSWMNCPAKSSLGLVIGGGDPAAYHAS